MRILEIVQNVPYPPVDGGRIAVYRAAQALARIGHQVGFVFPVQVGETVAPEFSREFPVWAMPADMKMHFSGMIVSLLSRVPYSYRKNQPRGFMDLVRRAAQEFRPDVIQTDFLHMARYGLAIARELRLGVILRTQNVDSTMMARFRDSQVNPFARAYAAIQHARLLAYEREYLPRFDRRVAVTSVDAAILSRLGGGVPVDVIGVGVDVAEGSAQPAPEEPDSIISVALMRWLPNAVGVRWFLDEVVPRVLVQVPTVVCRVVGSDPPSDIVRRSDGRRVVVTGFVPDIRPLVERSSVFVVPTRVGSGIRVKILEALALGKAVVSTSMGCEGIDGLVSGENILVADEPQEFADAVVSLLRDPIRRQKLGCAGRRLVANRYTWDSVAQAFAALYGQVSARARSPVGS